jgi:hypothetical protein
MRDLLTGSAAQVVCGGRGLVQNLQGGYYQLGLGRVEPGIPQPPLLLRAWEELTAELRVG